MLILLSIIVEEEEEEVVVGFLVVFLKKLIGIDNQAFTLLSAELQY